MSRNAALLIVAVFIALLSACAAPYGAKGSKWQVGGYQDKPLGPDRYAIEVEGNGYTSHETLEDYFHRRAKELCGSKPYTHTTSRTFTSKGSVYFAGTYSSSRSVSFPVVFGEIRCQN